jgi:crotonobetaine/carnitine-CoA ligase
MAVGATYTCMVETMALLLERQPESEDDRRHGIRVVMSGAPASLRLRAEARFGFKMVGGYGMTECGFPVAIPRELSDERLQHFLSFRSNANFAGWPVEENEVRIVDPEGRDVAEGETGEIWIRSGGLLKEYWRNPEATAAALQDGWLHTGDSGMRGPEGSVYFVDRIKDMIRRGGENVAPKEIEDVIHGHPDVAQAVAYPVPDPLYIQEAKVIVIAKPGRIVTAQAIWDWCEPRLAKYKVPRYVEFRDSVPTSGSGRAQKAELRQEPIEGLGQTFDRTKAPPPVGL